MKDERCRVISEIIAARGYPLTPNTILLDFGCGNGDNVEAYRQLGYGAFGCDFRFKDGEDTDALHVGEIIRLIPANSYQIPFPDNYFYFVFIALLSRLK
jgi:ubiquinone/menaquinone biosynthesis C-methylase UbiE